MTLQFERAIFLQSLHYPSDTKTLARNILTLVFNGEYKRNNPLSLFQNLFPSVNDEEGLKRMLMELDSHIALSLCTLINEYCFVDKEFLGELDEILYTYL